MTGGLFESFQYTEDEFAPILVPGPAPNIPDPSQSSMRVPICRLPLSNILGHVPRTKRTTGSAVELTDPSDPLTNDWSVRMWWKQTAWLLRSTNWLALVWDRPQ
jgi:hypothetical protein